MLLRGRIFQNHSQGLPFRGALLAGGAMAFAGLGDAFLYPLLPVYGGDLGFSTFAIGLLLSANRFVRILANTPIANLVHKLGMRKILIACTVLAALTTFSYGLHAGFFIFLLARLSWGLSYAGLKIATLNYAAQAKEKSGLAFGAVQSIKSFGPLSVLLFGPTLVKSFGIETGLFLIALVSGMGILFALSLPTIPPQNTSAKVKTKTTFSPNSINLLVFALSIAIDGILVVALAELFADGATDSGGLLAMVAFYLLLKKLFAFGFSLISGVLALRISPFKMYLGAVLLCIVALFLISLDFLLLGTVLAFLFNTLVVTFSPLIAISKQAQPGNSLQAISGVSTWWDLGAASGAFMGIFLIESLGARALFMILAALVCILFLNFINAHGNSNSGTV